MQQLDFEFVLFASAVVDYDYIMGLIAKYTEKTPAKQKTTREQLINQLLSSANRMDEKDNIVDYINSLELGKSRSEQDIRNGYQTFKTEKWNAELAAIAGRHQVTTAALKAFADAVLSRMIFDAEQLNHLLAPLELGWKERAKKELALMQDLAPQLKKLAQGRDIAGLKAYEN